MKHSKKILALAIAGALAVPQVALAAEDNLGMHYTSASEGFYGSLRIGVQTNPSRSTTGEAGFSNGSRVGVSGTHDLGDGLESYYTWELGVGVNNGSAVSVRMGHIGLRGAFGDLTVGSFWSQGYGWTYAGSDLATFWSGYNAPGVFQYRATDTVQYVTPDMNGFQSAVEVKLNDADADGNNVDLWQISAKYAIQGFSLGGSYANAPDGHSTAAVAGVNFAAAVADNPATNVDETAAEVAAVVPVAAMTGDDRATWVGKVGYSQDNWYVNAWYGEANDKDSLTANSKDTEYLGIGVGVSVNKVDLWVLHDTREGGAPKDGVPAADWDFTTFGVTYHLGSRTRTLLEYNTSSNAEDTVLIGLRHDF